MIPDGYLPQLRNTEDIPIQRSVTAMGITAPAEPSFKPYRYRGWDIDLFEDLPPVVRPKPPAPPQKTSARRYRPRRRRVAPTPSPDLLAAEAAAREAQDILAQFAAEVAPKPVEPKKPKPRPTIPSLPRKPARPTPGWKPLVGADLEDAWALLEEDA